MVKDMCWTQTLYQCFIQIRRYILIEAKLCVFKGNNCTKCISIKIISYKSLFLLGVFLFRFFFSLLLCTGWWCVCRSIVFNSDRIIWTRSVPFCAICGYRFALKTMIKWRGICWPTLHTTISSSLSVHLAIAID